MKQASTLLKLVAGLALAMMLTGGIVLALDCDDDGTCVTDTDSGGKKIGCTKGSSGDHCDSKVYECSCKGDSKGNCVCDN